LLIVLYFVNFTDFVYAEGYKERCDMRIAPLLALLVLGSLAAFAAPISIEDETLRVIAAAQDGRWWLEFSVKRADGSWGPVLATAAATTDAPWESKQRLVSEDPQIAWKQGGRVEETEAFFTKAESPDARTLMLTGRGRRGGD
jgi:hypothetical protein